MWDKNRGNKWDADAHLENLHGMTAPIAICDEHIFEAFDEDAVIGVLCSVCYVDITDINRSFRHSHFRDIVLEFAQKTRYKVRIKTTALHFSF